MHGTCTEFNLQSHRALKIQIRQRYSAGKTAESARRIEVAHLGDEVRRFLGATLESLEIDINAAESGNETRIPLKVVHEAGPLVL